MKIAQVCHRFHPSIGGIETHVFEVSKRLVARGIEVDIITTEKLPVDHVLMDKLGLNVIQFQSVSPENAVFFSLDLYNYMKRSSGSYDVVHAHNYQALPALFSALAKKENKFIFTPHFHDTARSLLGRLFYGPYHYFGRRIFEKSDAVICVSNFEKKKILEMIYHDESKMCVIPNGVNKEDFANIAKDENQKFILSVGRLEQSKGLQYLIDVLPYLDPDVVLHIVGDGPYRDALLQRAKEKGVLSRVHFSSRLSREELVKEYSLASLYVSLSLTEAFGITVAEALVAKTPCIVTTRSALADWIDNKYCFGIDDPTDVVFFSKLINKVSNIEVGHVKIASWGDVTDRIVGIYEKA